jgi:hypothetical protein
VTLLAHAKRRARARGRYLQVWGWPLLNLVLDAVRNLEEAAYFSMETFTTQAMAT